MASTPHIKIYSTTTCAYCRAEKKFLTEHGVKFEDIAVDSDPSAAQDMIKLSGQMGVPFTVITQADGQTETILGFDQARLTAALGL